MAYVHKQNEFLQNRDRLYASADMASVGYGL